MVEINKIEFKDVALLIKVDNHPLHKEEIIKELKASKIYHLHDNDGQKINRTDFSKKKNPYYTYFLKHVLTPFSKKILKTYGERKLGVNQVWFQHYIPGNYHEWHTHGGCNLSGIYYLDLPKEDMGTLFKKFKIKFVEGDMIIFPSHLLHKSPVFKEGSKTVLSFNISFCN